MNLPLIDRNRQDFKVGSGIVRCLAGQDDVYLGGDSALSSGPTTKGGHSTSLMRTKAGTTVKKQKIWEITYMDGGMRQIWYDGAKFNAILGLGKLDWVYLVLGFE